MKNNAKDKKFKSWEAFKKIQVIKVNGGQKLLLEGRPYMSWVDKDRMAQRVAISQLYKTGIANQEELAEAFGIHINSVYNYISRFEKEGVTGLLDQQSGPKGRWKITSETRFKILETAFSNKDISSEGIAELLRKRWGKKVSVRAIRRVLNENGFINQTVKRDGQVLQKDIFTAGEWSQQLFKGLNNSRQILPDYRQASLDNQDLSKEAGQDGTSIKENETIFGRKLSFLPKCLPAGKAGISVYSPAERIYLNRLERGGFSAYAGGLLFVPLLLRYNFISNIKKVIDIKTCEGYTLEQLCLTLLYCDVFGFKSIENFKTVYRDEFGILIGKQYSPSIFTLRRFLHKVRKLKKGEQLMDEFGKEYLIKGLVKWGVLYIDSHFLPYYGIYLISMGWHGVRQMPMKGSYNFMAVDGKFNPLIFFIRSSAEDLLEKIPELILRAKKIAKGVGIAEDKLIVIFDREGYSAELFREFDSDRLKSSFITWAKYFDNWKPEIKEEQFNKSVVVNYEIQKSEEVKYFEAEDRIMKRYGKIRAIVIQSGRKKKQAAIYTNDWETSADLIIQLICRCWGQETLFKTLRLEHHADYFPGHEYSELDKQPMVENPRVSELKRKKSNLLKDLHKLKMGFADILLNKASDEINWHEIREKKINTLADIESIRSQMLLIDLEVGNLPEEIKFDEAHDGAKLVEFDYEKKRFLDCIKVFSYTIQKSACEILNKYYGDQKDVWQILGMIAQRGADIKLDGNILTIRLKKFTDELIDYAARHFCDDLNKMEPVSVDKFRFQLRYEVE